MLLMQVLIQEGLHWPVCQFVSVTLHLGPDCGLCVPAKPYDQRYSGEIKREYNKDSAN